MSQVLAPATPQSASEPNAGSFEQREAEQLLIKEARRRQRRRQRVIGAVLSSVVAAAGVAWAVAGTSNPQPRTTSGQTVSLTAFPICSARHLHVSLSGQPQGAAGTIYFTLKLLSDGPECTVAPVAARGFNTTSRRYVGPWSNVFITSRAKTVATKGRAAYVPLGIGQTANWPASLCRAASVNAIRVALAGNHSLVGSVVVRTTVCTLTKSMHTQSASLSPNGA